MKKYINKIKHFLSVNNSGFTLLEIIIAVTIISIIASGFAAATVASTRANLNNTTRQKERGVAVTEIDSKIHPDKTYTSSDGLDNVQVKLYLDDNASPFATKDYYVVKKGGYKAYVKQND